MYPGFPFFPSPSKRRHVPPKSSSGFLRHLLSIASVETMGTEVGAPVGLPPCQSLSVIEKDDCKNQRAAEEPGLRMDWLTKESRR